MLIEVLVFNGDGGLFNVFREDFYVYRGAFLISIYFVEEFSITVENLSTDWGR